MNKEHMAILQDALDKKDIDIWNSWRKDNPDIRANLESANLYNANLSNADLSKANLSNADLSEANLSNANLSNANLRYANLYNADLSEANLYNANLSNADLSKANLSNADLSKANLSNADLYNANLSNADLSEADLSNANLSNADLSDCIMNWVSHDLISKRLRQVAGDDVMKRALAALIGSSPDWCWQEMIENIENTEAFPQDWALELFKSWRRDGDNAPKELIDALKE